LVIVTIYRKRDIKKEKRKAVDEKMKSGLAVIFRKFSSLETEHDKWERVFRYYLAYREARR
jgi:hypothetical protein